MGARTWRAVVRLVLVGTALAVWPGLERPFSAPKTVVLGVGALSGCAVLLWRGPIAPAPRAARRLASRWILSLALTTLAARGAEGPGRTWASRWRRRSGCSRSSISRWTSTTC